MNSSIFVPQKVLSLEKVLEKKNLNCLSANFLITPKIDGWYIYFPYTAATKTWYHPRKSSMQVCKSFAWLKDDGFLDNLPKFQEDCILITEAYIPGMAFSEMNGVFNRTTGNYQCSSMKFAVHDIVFLNSVRAYPMYAKERFDVLMNLNLTQVQKFFERVFLLGRVSGTQQTKWKQLFYSSLEQGYEGIIAKREDSIYSLGKRNSDLIKLKVNCTVDCVAVALEEGIGEKGEDSLILISERQNGVRIRTVISKHLDKNAFRRNPESILRKVVEIKAMEEFPDGQLRQPVFSHIREDKNIQDIN